MPPDAVMDPHATHLLDPPVAPERAERAPWQDLPRHRAHHPGSGWAAPAGGVADLAAGHTRPVRADRGARGGVDELSWTVEAFEAAYDRHVDELFRYLARRVGPDAAEELVAQAFVEAWANRDAFEPERGSEGAWLQGIATNLLRRHLRTEQRRSRAVTRLSARDDHVASLDVDQLADRLEAAETLPDLGPALASLSPGERDALLLHAVDGVSYEDIAARLDVPIGTVRSRISRARGRLGPRLGRSEQQGGGGGRVR